MRKIFEENEKPLDRIVTDGGFCAIFRKIACIGDSLSSGEFETRTESGEKKPNILVVAPPPIGEGMLESPVAPTMGFGCVEKSRELAHYYREQCALIGAHFLDAATVGAVFNEVDYMHLTRDGHAALAAALAELVPQLVQ